MTELDLRPPGFRIVLPAGDSFDALELTVDEPMFAAGTWTAQLRGTAPEEVVHASFQITPNGAGTGVVLSLDAGTTRALHTEYARFVRDPELGMVNRYEGVFDAQSVAVDGSTLTAISGTLILDQDVTR